MKLLICTQAVDLDDPILGFFHRWIEEFAKRSERVHVICLKAGRHQLPSNVSVHSLGKERGVSRFGYMWNFYHLIWSLRHEYDAVFVHMNQEYVLLGGPYWCLGGKRVVLWRNHKTGLATTRVACMLAHTVCYTSASAFVARYRNAVQMPVGIDTEHFAPRGAPQPHSLLFLGRLDTVKRPDIFLAALKHLQNEGVAFRADMYGDPTPGREAYATELKKKYAGLSGVSFHNGVRNAETPKLYRSHAVYVNLTPSGSFDKTIGEAMACGTPVVCANDAVRSVVPDRLFIREISAEAVAAGIRAALTLSEAARRDIATRARAYIEREHSLPRLIATLVVLCSAKQ